MGSNSRYYSSSTNTSTNRVSGNNSSSTANHYSDGTSRHCPRDNGFGAERPSFSDSAFRFENRTSLPVPVSPNSVHCHPNNNGPGGLYPRASLKVGHATRVRKNPEDTAAAPGDTSCENAVSFCCNVSVVLKAHRLTDNDTSRMISFFNSRFGFSERGRGAGGLSTEPSTISADSQAVQYEGIKCDSSTVKCDTVYFMSLDLSENGFSCLGISRLCQWLLLNNQYIRLRSLKLYRNNISDAGAMAIAKVISLQVSALEELHLSHNRISNAGAAALFKSVTDAKTGLPPEALPPSGRSRASTIQNSEFVYPRCETYRAQTLLPVWIRLEYNRITETQQILEKWDAESRVTRGLDANLKLTCSADRSNHQHGGKDPHCSPARCLRSNARHSPLLHLYSFHHQSPPQASQPAARSSVNNNHKRVVNEARKAPASEESSLTYDMHPTDDGEGIAVDSNECPSGVWNRSRKLGASSEAILSGKTTHSPSPPTDNPVEGCTAFRSRSGSAPALQPSDRDEGLPLYVFIDASCFVEMRNLRTGNLPYCNLFSFPGILSSCRKKAFCYSSMTPDGPKSTSSNSSNSSNNNSTTLPGNHSSNGFSLDTNQSLILMVLSSMQEGLLRHIEAQPGLRNTLQQLHADFLGPLAKLGVVESVDDIYKGGVVGHPWFCIQESDRTRAASMGVPLDCLRVIDFAFLWAHHLNRVSGNNQTTSCGKPDIITQNKNKTVALRPCFSVLLTCDPRVEAFFSYLIAKHNPPFDLPANLLDSHNLVDPSVAGGNLICMSLDYLNSIMAEAFPTMNSMLSQPGLFETTDAPPDSNLVSAVSLRELIRKKVQRLRVRLDTNLIDSAAISGKPWSSSNEIISNPSFFLPEDNNNNNNNNNTTNMTSDKFLDRDPHTWPVPTSPAPSNPNNRADFPTGFTGVFEAADHRQWFANNTQCEYAPTEQGGLRGRGAAAGGFPDECVGTTQTNGTWPNSNFDNGDQHLGDILEENNRLRYELSQASQVLQRLSAYIQMYKL